MENEKLTVRKKLELIDEVLTRSVGEFVDPDGTFRKKLIRKANGEDININIKFGIDPTRPDIHLGHAVIFKTLKTFQQIGCKVIFLIGDFTALIGDPTGKNKVRPMIHIQEVKKNQETYLAQVGKLLLTDAKHFSWMVNSDWYTDISDIFSQEGFYDEALVSEKLNSIPGIINKDVFLSNLKENRTVIEKAIVWEVTRMQSQVRADKSIETVSFRTFLSTLSKITFARLIERDMFQKRLKDSEPLFMHEMMYPVLQGLDSNTLAKVYGSCDLEIGGTDQTFNMLMARDTMSMEFPIDEVQSVLSIKILEGIDGKEKMSKSLDNYVAITDAPNKMFTTIMSIPDTSIINYFELATDVPMSEVRELEERMKSGEIHPRDLKVRLAKEIVTLYHGAEAAENAEEARPSQAPPETTIIEFMVAEKLASSKSEARRKIEQGGVELDGEKVTDWQMELSENDDGKVLKVGKKDFVKIVF